VEDAITWVCENGAAGVSDAQMEQEGLYEEYKMIFVVNGSLSMGIGKISAQVKNRKHYKTTEMFQSI